MNIGSVGSGGGITPVLQYQKAELPTPVQEARNAAKQGEAVKPPTGGLSQTGPIGTKLNVYA